jgi:GTP 3',8-cyclase
MLVDSFGRKITYLRISVTDRCNYRCVYCMPLGGLPQLSHTSIMRYEEIEKVVRVAAENGVRAIRLTGGEPLVRLDLPVLVKMISSIPEIEDISITTNGLLLEKMAAPLAEAGLNRINVSMDTLDPDKFNRITRGGSLERLWRGVEVAESVGLYPIKFNTVAMRGINDDELVEIGKLSIDHPWDMRFIELMPVLNQETWGPDFPLPENIYLSVQEMHELFHDYELIPVEKNVGEGPARDYYLPGAKGKIGFISPVGEHFCNTCNRLRLTSDGNLRPCLLTDIEIPLLPAMRAGEPILPILERAAAGKPLGHELKLNHLPEVRCMRQIGG